jgi:hypothetical protein
LNIDPARQFPRLQLSIINLSTLVASSPAHTVAFSFLFSLRIRAPFIIVLSVIPMQERVTQARNRFPSAHADQTAGAMHISLDALAACLYLWRNYWRVLPVNCGRLRDALRGTKAQVALFIRNLTALSAERHYFVRAA